MLASESFLISQRKEDKVDQREMGNPKPNCRNASNPYHECTQACLQPNTSKPLPPNKNKIITSSGPGPGKKVNVEERRHYAGCPKASNPYHNCDDNCNKKGSGSATPLNYESKPAASNNKPKALEPPPVPVAVAVADNNNASSSSSSSSSPTSNANSHNKEVVVEPADEHIPLEPHSGEIQPHHVKDEEDKVVAAVSHEVIPITYVDDDAGEGFPHHQICNEEEEQDSDHGGETESVVSESPSRVAVGGYNVKESFARILRSVLHKYGDIGATCQLESLVMRSYYIECVCFVVQELQSASILHLTNSKLKELSAVLKDVESAQLRVAWLRSVLDEMELIHQNQQVQEAKANSDREVESLREELHSQLQTLAQKEQEVADIKTRRIPEIRDRLSQLDLKSSEIDTSMLSIQSMVDNLHSKSLIDELVL